MLQKQIKLQEEQFIELAYYLNLPMVQFGTHQKALNNLDAGLIIANKTLILMMNALVHLRYLVPILTDLCTGLTCLTSGVQSLLGNADVLYKHMKVLASHMVNPLVVPPDDLHHILVQVKDDV